MLMANCGLLNQGMRMKRVKRLLPLFHGTNGGSLHYKTVLTSNPQTLSCGLDLYGILAETENRGISFDQLLTILEQDDWVYNDGKSTTCVSFILSMYKEAGVFGPLSSSIQVTEFTIRDAYMLKIFENNGTRLPNWCNTENGLLPFCQILREYRMELPEYNTIEPYAYMNENCPSLRPCLHIIKGP